MIPSARAFKQQLKSSIMEESKTTYGKKELILYIEEIYSQLLEWFIEKGEKDE